MPQEWYNYPEAQSILGNLNPTDLGIEEFLGKNGRYFVWVLPDDLDSRLEVIKHRAVDANVGFKLSDCDRKELWKQEQWFDEEERQATLQDRLVLMYGDPNVLLGYSVESANNLWQKDSNIIRRLSERV